MTDIKRQLDDLLDAQPYRQDYYDGIVASFQALEQQVACLQALVNGMQRDSDEDIRF